MLAASDGQEAKLGQLKHRGTADCQGLTVSSGGWRTGLAKKQEAGSMLRLGYRLGRYLVGEAVWGSGMTS